MEKNNLTSSFPSIRCTQRTLNRVRGIANQLQISVATLVRACVHDLLNDPDPRSKLVMRQAQKIVSSLETPVSREGEENGKR